MDIAMTAPVGQNQIHINLVIYEHRCMRQFFGKFFGESHRYGLWNSLFPIYYNQLEVKNSVLSTPLRIRLDNIGLLRNRNHNLPGARCTKNLKIYLILDRKSVV